MSDELVSDYTDSTCTRTFACRPGAASHELNSVSASLLQDTAEQQGNSLLQGMSQQEQQEEQDNAASKRGYGSRSSYNSVHKYDHQVSTHARGHSGRCNEMIRHETRRHGVRACADGQVGSLPLTL